jgi:hypothetical protein
MAAVVNRSKSSRRASATTALLACGIAAGRALQPVARTAPPARPARLPPPKAPPGTPADANAVSWHGLLHLVCGSIGFAGFIGACFVVARRFSSRQQPGWAAYSRVTGVIYAAAFVGIASGSQQGGAIATVVVLAFTAAVALGWAWLSAMQLQLTQEVVA